MNSLLAAILSGFIGLGQLITILILENHEDQDASGLLSSELIFPIFAALVMTEILTVISLSIYRISPWLLRLTGEKWEADRVARARTRYGSNLQLATILATVLRRLVVAIDSGTLSVNLGASLAVALAALAIPRPKA